MYDDKDILFHYPIRSIHLIWKNDTHTKLNKTNQIDICVSSTTQTICKQNDMSILKSSKITSGESFGDFLTKASIALRNIETKQKWPL